ncbi:hypothetical protein ACIBTV_27485 [Micromonospora sp. NPDC049366]|uniref:hypothetical protein n=1 Tax=Micromonospora sp. NPDC049366 TaxID=3364271 RepID=UPI0037B6DDB1
MTAPEVAPLDGPPGPGVVEVIDAEGRRWCRDEESLTEVWHCDGGEGPPIPPEVLDEVFGPLLEVLG